MLISNTDDNASYKLQLIAQNNSEPLMDDSPEWIQYIQDHRQLIIAHSQQIDITEEKMTKYRYRPRKFLANLGVREDLELVFRLINRFGDDLSFTENNLESVFIPDYEYVMEMRKMYITILSQIESL